MTTRDALKTEILDDLDRSSGVDGVRVLAAISNAIKHYQPKRFFFNVRRTVTFSTVAATDLYTFATIGTEFYSIDRIFVTVAAGDVRELEKVNYLDIEQVADEGTDSGIPTQYAYIDQALRFWPSPDAIYSMRITGHIKYPEPSAGDTAGNEWFTEAYELIRCRAKAYLYAHVFPSAENLQLASVMNQGEASAFKTLKEATEAKVSQDRLIATEF